LRSENVGESGYVQLVESLAKSQIVPVTGLKVSRPVDFKKSGNGFFLKFVSQALTNKKVRRQKYPYCFDRSFLVPSGAAQTTSASSVLTIAGYR